MAYVKNPTWEDYPSTATPVDAEALNHVENGLFDVAAQVDALALGGGAPLTGTGAPEGAVTAPVGTEYIDTAGTNGAWRWLKKTGTGATGWVVTHADTGWRSLTIDETYAGTAGALWIAGAWCIIRRLNDVVHLNACVNQNGSNGIFATVPTGFRHEGNGGSGIQNALMIWGCRRDVPAASTTIKHQLFLGELSTLGNMIDTRFVTSWPTDEAWPTSLPGSAA